MIAAVLVAALTLTFLQAPRDADLAQAITFIGNGDFEAAETVLRAVTVQLEGQPGRMRELADAYLYLAIAQLEQERPKEAARNFYEARRRNRTLSLSKYEFSAEVRRAFDAANAGSATVTEERPLVPAPRPPVPVEEWIEKSTNSVALRMALGTESGKCDGVISIDGTVKELKWMTTAGTPCESFTVPLAGVRPVTAARGGGVALSFVKQLRPTVVLMPAPSADFFEAGIDGLTRADLTDDANVQIRNAIRHLNQFIEGGSSPGITESLYGVAVDASLAELMDTPGAFDGSTVRTQGKFEIVSRDRNQYLLTAETFTVLVVPDPDAGVAALLRAEAQQLRGQVIEVTGAFKRRNLAAPVDKGAPEFEVQFWRYETAASIEDTFSGNRMSIEDLVDADPLPSTPVTVIGKFRGGNLFADLPYSSRKRSGDWIIKDDLFAIWVTGKDPEGDGWSLNVRATRDTVNWLRVTGVPKLENGFIYLAATDVALSRPPTPTSSPDPPPPPATTAKAQPAEIMFTIPVQGVEEAAADSVFAVQFTKAMDANSFSGRVQLRYARAVAGERAFTNSAIGYDPVRRVLTIDPGEALLGGRVLECVLLPGIRDSEGVELKGADTRAPEEPLQILRWTIASR